MRQGKLLAAPFDLDRLEVTGPAVQVGADVVTDSVWGITLYDVAADGSLGAAIGGGFGLSLVPDFRVAAPEARFAANFTRLGFHPGFGLTATLTRPWPTCGNRAPRSWSRPTAWPPARA